MMIGSRKVSAVDYMKAQKTIIDFIKKQNRQRRDFEYTQRIKDNGGDVSLMFPMNVKPDDFTKDDYYLDAVSVIEDFTGRPFNLDEFKQENISRIGSSKGDSMKPIQSHSVIYKENEMPPEMRNKIYYEIYFYNEDDDRILGGSDRYKSNVGMNFANAKRRAKKLMYENDCNTAKIIDANGNGIIIESGINRRNNMKTIKSGFSVNQFDSFQDFLWYAEQHYLPLLDKVSHDDYELTMDDKRLFGFLYDDMKSMIDSYDGTEIESACHGKKKKARRIKSSVDGKFSYLDENVQDAVAEVEKYLGIEAEPGDYYAYFNLYEDDLTDKENSDIERICGKYEVEFVPLDSAGDEDKGFVIMSYDDWNKE